MKARRAGLVVVMGALLAAGVMAAAGAKASSDLKFLVLKDANGKPVRNAAIVLHQVDRRGHQERAGMELKTDNEGKTGIDGIPYGKVRIQVIAPGFQTFGQDYDINQPAQEITIKLQRPQEQYSIYK
jgi:Carboxypeptidase regulatory-like domain